MQTEDQDDAPRTSAEVLLEAGYSNSRVKFIMAGWQSCCINTSFPS